MTNALDTGKLEREVKSVYRSVAERPQGEYHFEMGRPLAERLGYDPADLDRIPAAALESFAGVGHHFDLATLKPGEHVLDLGSGSGTDVFVAALHVGEEGSVTGLDMTPEQLEKARALRDEAGLDHVTFQKGKIEEVPAIEESFDVVISNGVINLSPEKERVFAEAERLLRPGGRFAISDIISEEQMPEGIKNDADLWAACIGGAMQVDSYVDSIEAAGLEVSEVRDNTDYEFTSDRAVGACQKYGVKSVSVVASKRT